MNPLTEPRTRPHLVAALVALLALLLYARTVGYEYVWDDLAYLSDARTYTGLEGAIKAFTEPFFLPYYYRPVAMFSFVFSGQPSVQHGINVLLHAANTTLVFYCARALMPRAVSLSNVGVWTPALAALAFAVHPAAVEAVAWVSGRYDTLMCSFVLATSLAALSGELTRKRLVLVFFLFACAMGSKESAIGLPAALPFLLLLKWRLAGMKTSQIKAQVGTLVRLLAMLTLAVALYIAARQAVIHTLFASSVEMALGGSGVLDKFNVSALAVTSLVKLIVAPLKYSAPLHPFKYGSEGVLLPQTFIFTVCLMVLLVLAFWKKTRLNFPLALLAALAVSWPVLHIVGIPNRDNIISDRYALAPLAFLLTALAAIAGCAMKLTAAPSKRRAAAYAQIACLLWEGMLAAYSSATIPLWRDETTLWAFAHRQVPTSRIAHSNYISTLMMQKRWSEADAEMVLHMGMFPAARRNLSDVSNWILIRTRLGNLDGARELFTATEREIKRVGVAKLNAHDLSALYLNGGILEADAGHFEQAEHYLEQSLQILSTNPMATSFLAKVRVARSRAEKPVSKQFP